MYQNTVLLTGGTGFIGSHCALELILQDFEIIIVDNLSNSFETVIGNIKKISMSMGKCPNIHFYKTNIRNSELLDKIFTHHPNIRSVIHFASHKSVGESVKNPIKYYDNNISGLIELVKQMQKHEVKELIFSSSATVYGKNEDMPVNEYSKTDPINPYGKTKLFCEEILKDLALSDNDFKIISLRYFNPVASHPSGLLKENPKSKSVNLFPAILKSIEENDTFQIFGNNYPTQDGTGIRDYIHVVDIAKAHVKALDYLMKNDVNFEIFNLGSQKGYSVLSVIRMFERVTNHKIEYEFSEKREGDAGIVFSDSSKAKRLLNWIAEKTLKEMVVDSLKSIDNNYKNIQNK